jgi:hypothetical protein
VTGDLTPPASTDTERFVATTVALQRAAAAFDLAPHEVDRVNSAAVTLAANPLLAGRWAAALLGTPVARIRYVQGEPDRVELDWPEGTVAAIVMKDVIQQAVDDRNAILAAQHELRQAAADVDANPPVLACVVCGCTDDAACPDGCSWAGPICSACLPVTDSDIDRQTDADVALHEQQAAQQ